MIQEALDLGWAQFQRMALAMKQDELPDPVAVCLLRTWAEMAPSADDGKLIKQ